MTYALLKRPERTAAMPKQASVAGRRSPRIGGPTADRRHQPPATLGLGAPFQAKLKVGAVHDPLEQEADAIAERVVSGLQGATSNTPPASARELIQRQCKTCDSEDEEAMVQRTAATTSPAPAASSGLAPQLHQARQGGRPLEIGVRQPMERGFGTDFSQVKIHADDRAAGLAQQLNARAFTTGNDVFFNRGEFRPQHTDGKRLLAHELSHVVQQRGTTPVVRRKEKDRPGDTASVIRAVRPEGHTSAPELYKKAFATALKPVQVNPVDENHADKLADQITEVATPESIPDSNRDCDAFARLKANATDVLGVPLSSVTVHTGAFAQRLNNSLNTRALTYGNHIFFSSGEYRPATRAGANLLAHEFAHVAQQRSGGLTLQPKFHVGSISFHFTQKGLETLEGALSVEREIMDLIRWMNASEESFSPIAAAMVLSNRSDAMFRSGLLATMDAIRTGEKGKTLSLTTPFAMPGAWVPSASVRNTRSDEFSASDTPMRSDFSLDPRTLRDATAAEKIQELLDSTTIPIRIDCGTAVSLAVYYTLVERLGAEAFNRLFYDKVDLVRLVNPKGLLGHFMKKEALTTTGRDAVFELRPGDIVYFRNVPEYSICLQQDHKSGVWAGEWATFKGNNKFVGFGVTSEFDYDKIESDLHREAVAVCGSRHTITKEQVPGLRDPDGKAYAFRLDMQKIWLLLANNL